MLNDIFETYVLVDDTPADLNTEITTARHRKPTHTQTVHMFWNTHTLTGIIHKPYVNAYVDEQEVAHVYKCSL